VSVYFAKLKGSFKIENVERHFGAPVGVQQRLMRHADVRTTLNLYGDALTMRSAQEKVVRLAIPDGVN
jgi:integrase